MVNETIMGEKPLIDDQLYVDIYARGEDGISVATAITTYMASNDGINPPDEESPDWSETIPSSTGYRYLWTKTEYIYTNDVIKTVFSVSGYGATFIPFVDENGNISWSNDKGYVNPTTQNITGPRGIPGPLDIQVVESLESIVDPSDTTFYAVPAPLVETDLDDQDLRQRLYDLYYWIPPQNEEDEGHFEPFNSNSIYIKQNSENSTYYIAGNTSSIGNSFFYNTGMTYTKGTNNEKGIGRIDGDKITTGLFYDIH